jgi:hypothetical protein
MAVIGPVAYVVGTEKTDIALLTVGEPSEGGDATGVGDDLGGVAIGAG